MSLLFYLVAFLVIIGLGLVVTGWRESREEMGPTVSSRVAKLQDRGRGPNEEDRVREAEREFARREEERVTKRPQVNRLPSVSRMVTSHAVLSRLDNDLMQVKSRWRASELLALSVFLAVTGLVLSLVLGLHIIIVVLMVVLCLCIPWGYVKWLRARYYRKFDEQLSDTLMLMANGLRAGFSFLQALEMVSRETPAPICDEFGRVMQEIAVGVTVQEALTNLTRRINSMDLQLLVTAVLIQREIGGALAEVLEIIAAVIRERMRIKREIRILTTQGRMTGAILGGLPIFLGLAIHLTGKIQNPLEPSFVQPLFSTDFGRNLLLVGLVLQAIGFAIIMRIVSIRV